PGGMPRRPPGGVRRPSQGGLTRRRDGRRRRDPSRRAGTGDRARRPEERGLGARHLARGLGEAARSRVEVGVRGFAPLPGRTQARGGGGGGGGRRIASSIGLMTPTEWPSGSSTIA